MTGVAVMVCLSAPGGLVEAMQSSSIESAAFGQVAYGLLEAFLHQELLEMFGRLLSVKGTCRRAFHVSRIMSHLFVMRQPIGCSMTIKLSVLAHHVRCILSGGRPCVQKNTRIRTGDIVLAQSEEAVSYCTESIA